MADVLINENNRRIDDDDMKALISALGELGFSADVDPSTRIQAGQATDWWVLVFRWVGDEAARVAFDAALAAAFLKAKKHFTDRGKVPPARAEVYEEFDLYAPTTTLDDEDDRGDGDDPAPRIIDPSS